MRLSIIPSDRSVYVDGIGYHDIDMSWIPNIGKKKIHAVQWLDGEGEIEFVGPDQNLKITELGAFEKAVDLWNEKREKEEFIKQRLLEEEERRRKEEEERLKSQFLVFYDDDYDFDDDDDEDDEDKVEKLVIPPSETHIPPLESLPHENEEEEEEDEDLFYDIEELLKEI